MPREGVYQYAVGEKVTGMVQMEGHHRIWISIVGEVAAEDDTDDWSVQISVRRARLKPEYARGRWLPWEDWRGHNPVWVLRKHLQPVPADGEGAAGKSGPKESLAEA